MFEAPYRAAVIGRTGRGDYGHGLDVAVLDQPKLQRRRRGRRGPQGPGRGGEAARGRRTPTPTIARCWSARSRSSSWSAPRWLDGHREMILACAERGVLGVFCEKPLAPDLASCDAIVAACERSHVKLAMAFQTRYSPRYERVKAADRRGGDRRGARAPGPGQGGPPRRRRGPDGPGRPHPGSLPRPAGRAGLVLRPRDRAGPAGRAGPGPRGRRGDRAAGRRPGRRDVRLPGQPRPSPTSPRSRPKEPGRRFGLTICGSKGCIGWAPAGCPRPSSWPTPPGPPPASKPWTPITGAGEGRPGPSAANDLVAGNRAIVADLIHAVETDTQPRTDVAVGPDRGRDDPGLLRLARPRRPGHAAPGRAGRASAGASDA